MVIQKSSYKKGDIFVNNYNFFKMIFFLKSSFWKRITHWCCKKLSLKTHFTYSKGMCLFHAYTHVLQQRSLSLAKTLSDFLSFPDPANGQKQRLPPFPQAPPNRLPLRHFDSHFIFNKLCQLSLIRNPHIPLSAYHHIINVSLLWWHQICWPTRKELGPPWRCFVRHCMRGRRPCPHSWPQRGRVWSRRTRRCWKLLVNVSTMWRNGGPVRRDCWWSCQSRTFWLASMLLLQVYVVAILFLIRIVAIFIYFSVKYVCSLYFLLGHSVFTQLLLGMGG